MTKPETHGQHLKLGDKPAMATNPTGNQPPDGRKKKGIMGGAGDKPEHRRIPNSQLNSLESSGGQCGMGATAGGILSFQRPWSQGLLVSRGLKGMESWSPSNHQGSLQGEPRIWAAGTWDLKEGQGLSQSVGGNPRKDLLHILILHHAHMHTHAHTRKLCEVSEVSQNLPHSKGPGKLISHKNERKSTKVEFHTTLG